MDAELSIPKTIIGFSFSTISKFITGFSRKKHNKKTVQNLNTLNSIAHFFSKSDDLYNTEENRAATIKQTINQAIEYSVLI